MRAYTEQDGLFDFEQTICSIEPVELDLECCDILTKPVDNTGKPSIVNLPNQIISE